MPSEMVLVTGGTGFIAGWCIVELLKQGYSVRTTIRSAGREAAVRASVASQIDPAQRLSFAVADLTDDAGWEPAAQGCSAILHVASPLGTDAPRDRNALVAPARGGVLRVLAAADAVGVDRVVMTSAAATARVRGSARAMTEADWADPDDDALDPYRYSKVLAELAAWDFAATARHTTLTTILPGAVFGPVLPGTAHGSVTVIDNMLKGRPPMLVNLGLSVVDVRDLAGAHVAALTAGDAPGRRFLTTGTFTWMTEIASTLRAELGPDGANIPRRTMPDFAFRLVALAMPQLRMFTHDLGRRDDFDDGAARRSLNFTTRPLAQTLVDCAQTLLQPVSALS